MKLRTWTASIAALVFSAAPVFAVESNVQWSNDGMLQPASCDSSCDPCDCGDACHCGSGVCGTGLFSGIGGGCLENFSLASMMGISDDSQWQIGGWTQFGYHDQLTPLATTRGDALSFNDVPGNLNLQQQWLYFGRTADGSNGFDLGFRSDFIYGTDAQKTQAFGNPGNEWDNGWDNGVYGWAIPQLYGEVAMNDFSVKVGHFFTICGYEVVAATGNFFYSHALTMFNTEPFTHTGVLSTYTGFEGLTLYNGWTAGWDTGFTSSNAGSTYLGGFTYELGDNVAFTYTCTFGNIGLRGAGGNPAAPNSRDDYSHSIVMTAALTDKLNYVFQTDYLKIENAAAGASEEDLGINQYLFYNWTDAIAFGTRIEWWSNEGVSNNEITTGVNVKLLDNLIMRPEVRQDWVPATGFDENVTACDFILTY